MMKFKDKYKTLIKGIITFMIFFSNTLIQIFFVKIFNINLDKITDKEATIISCAASFIITILLIAFYKKDLKKEWKIFKENLSENLDIGFKYWILGLGIMITTNLIINFIFRAGQANNEEAVQRMIKAVPYLLLIFAGVFAPITEEITFRKVFKDIIKNKVIYVLISGLLFGYLHVSSAESLAQFLYIIPYSSLGICFAISYVKTDTVFTSISMHMLHNTLLTLLSILA